MTLHSVSNIIESDEDKGRVVERKGRKKTAKSNFLSWLSKQLNVEIRHIFPVRGHCYCVGDRNFGSYSQIVKKTEVIEVLADYLNILKNCRKKLAFKVVHGS